MELKYPDSALKGRIGNRSNRTFMELKYEKNYLENGQFLVLIAPLWN